MKTYKFDNRLISSLDTYSDTRANVGSNLQQAFDNADKTEKIVPVLGMQGTGKSTLINGLLKENILPNDVDETTCVPVEVKYGEKEHAVVHFFESSKTEDVNTREELADYVDNNYNPGNKKKVERIELFRKNNLLADGLVIVDLPGVGSMTKVNEETTNRYIENLCSAIFVIPTVPTIRGKEAMFIKSLWSRFATAIFVQNEWGETQQEINESMDFNSTLLKGIANELHNPYDGKIILVNAYNAIKGALDGNKQMVESSHINVLYDKIFNLSAHWEDVKYSLLLQRLLLAIKSSINVVKRRINDIDKGNEERKRNNEERLKAFDNTTKEIENQSTELLSAINDKCNEISIKAKNKAKDTCDDMRANMHRVIDGGVYDGEHLSKAFDDYTENTSEKFFDSIADDLHSLKSIIDEGLINIAETEFTEEIGEDAKIDGYHFDSESKFKFEKGVNAGMNIGGAVGGALLAARVAGILMSNPAGWAIALIGLGIYTIFSLSGYAISKGVGAHRAREARKIVDPKIKDIEEQLYKKVLDTLGQTEGKVHKMLDKVLEGRKEQRRNLLNSFENVLENEERPKLESDLKYLINKEEEYGSIRK